MTYKIIIISVIISIVMSGCSTMERLNIHLSSSPTKGETLDTIEPELSTPAIQPTQPVTLSSKTLIIDEKNHASIYYDRGFYLKIDNQEYKLKDDYSESYAIIADEFEFPRPAFSLFTIEKDNLYFVVELQTPTNGIGSTAESWYFLYKNNTLKLIKYLGPFDLQNMYPEIKFKSVDERVIQFNIPGLNNEFRIRTGNAEYTELDDYKFTFSAIIDITVEKDYVILDCILRTVDRQVTFSHALLYFNIDENGIEIFNIKNK